MLPPVTPQSNRGAMLPPVTPQSNPVDQLPKIMTRPGLAIDLSDLKSHFAQFDSARLTEINQWVHRYLNNLVTATDGIPKHHVLTLVHYNDGMTAPLQWKWVAKKVIDVAQAILEERAKAEYESMGVDFDAIVTEVRMNLMEQRIEQKMIKVLTRMIEESRQRLDKYLSELEKPVGKIAQDQRQIARDQKEIRQRTSRLFESSHQLNQRYPSSVGKEQPTSAETELKQSKVSQPEPKPHVESAKERAVPAGKRAEPEAPKAPKKAGKQDAEPVQQKKAPTRRETTSERRLRHKREIEQARQDYKKEIQAKEKREAERRKTRGLPSLDEIMDARIADETLKGPYSEELWKTVCSDLESLMGTVPKVENDWWLENLHILCFPPKQAAAVSKKEAPAKPKATPVVSTPRTVALSPERPLLERGRVVHVSETSLSQKVTRLFKRLIESIKDLVMTLGRHMSFSLRATQMEEKRFIQWALASQRRIEASAG